MFSKKEYVILILGVILNSLTIITANTYGQTNFTRVLSGMYVILALSRPLKQRITLISMALPNTKMLGFFRVSDALIICVLSAIFNIKHFEKKNGAIFFLAFLYMLYATQYYFRFLDVNMGFVMPFKAALTILFFTIICTYKPIAKDAFNIGFKAAIGLYCGIVSSALSTINYHGSQGRLEILGNDSNILSVEIAFAMAYISVFFFLTKRISVKLYFFFVASLGLLCFMCGSRNGLLLFAIIMVITYLNNAKSIKKSMTTIFIVGVSLIVIANSKAGQQAINSYNQRMDRLEQKEDFTNGRVQLWKDYIKVLNSDKELWLIGLGSYEHYGLDHQAHNFLLEGIAGNGIIGISLLYFIYICIFIRQHKTTNLFYKHKPSFYQFTPFLIPILGGITLHGLMNIMNITMMYVGILCLSKPDIGKNQRAKNLHQRV